jgi:hypothetical protein
MYNFKVKENANYANFCHNTPYHDSFPLMSDADESLHKLIFG